MATTSCTCSGTACKTRRARRTQDFEFNQSEEISSNGVTPVRLAGDLLIQYDLANGGTNPKLFSRSGHDRQQVPVRSCEQHSLLG
jgi:hypothetical protein